MAAEPPRTTDEPSPVAGPETRETSNSEPAAPEATAPRGWIGWSLIIGCLLGVPSGWLLAYLAALPGFLGLFFFLLLGLVIGAAMFRAGRSSAPVERSTLWAIGGFVTLVIIGSSLVAEYEALGSSVDQAVRDSIFESLSSADRQELRRQTSANVDAFLDENYPPGGFAGYLRWAATNGAMECPRVFRDSTIRYELPHRKQTWLIRLALSTLLVGWVIMSQYLGLASNRSAAASAAERGQGDSGSSADK